MLDFCLQLFFIHFSFKRISVPHQTIQKTASHQVRDMTPKRDTGCKELVLQLFNYPRQLLTAANSRIHPVLRLCPQRGRVYTAAQDSEKSHLLLLRVVCGDVPFTCISVDTSEGSPRQFFFKLSVSHDFLTWRLVKEESAAYML